jgi:hypothetical protein
VSPDDRAFLLDVALSDWTRWRAICGAAPWRKKLNNFELSEVDAQFACMDRAMRDLISVSQQRAAEAPNAEPHPTGHLNGDRAIQSLPAAPTGPPASRVAH